MRNRLLRFAVYGVIGVVVGGVVALFDYVTIEVLLHRLDSIPLWQLALAPGVGLLAAHLIMSLPTGGSTATSDELIAAYHDRRDRLRLRNLPTRLAAGIATVGLGGALGLEGPSIYAGGTVGASLQHRLRWLFSDKDARMLMVAGAAAGVAAIFKTPATGVLFALEVPYKGDVARRALLPSLIASATSYLTFVTFLGTDPIFDIEPVRLEFGDEVVTRVIEVTFDVGELVAAALLGLIAGFGALAFARILARVKAAERDHPWWQRWIVSAAVLGGLAVLTAELYEAPLSVGPDGIERLFDYVVSDEATLGLVAVLFGVRLVASMSTLLGSGVGGVFIPLAIQGLILGRLASLALDETNLLDVDPDTARVLFPAIGVAAFLGAGYRTPLASVMFVAESTGQAGFVVPALVATAVSQVMMGPTSVSPYQRDTRSGHLEHRFTLPISAALTTDVRTLAPDTTVSAFVWDHALRHRVLDVPVVADGRYLGMAHLHDANALDREHWGEATVGDLMHTSGPAARPSWSLREATRVMEAEDVETLPVVDVDGGFLGVVTAESVVKLDEILGETGA